MKHKLCVRTNSGGHVEPTAVRDMLAVQDESDLHLHHKSPPDNDGEHLNIL